MRTVARLGSRFRQAGDFRARWPGAAAVGRGAVAAGVALASALGAGLAVAQDVTAPAGVAAPAGATHALAPLESAAGVAADFIAVCSRAVENLSTGMTEAQRRGWRIEGEQSAMLAALLGSAALSKDVEGVDSALLTLNRIVFPHVVASNCLMNLVGAGTDVVDTAAIGKIPGIEGGAALILGTSVGRWSLVDDAGEVVTVTDTTAGSRFRVLSMSRAVLTEHGRAVTSAAAPQP